MSIRTTSYVCYFLTNILFATSLHQATALFSSNDQRNFTVPSIMEQQLRRRESLLFHGKNDVDLLDPILIPPPPPEGLDVQIMTMEEYKAYHERSRKLGGKRSNLDDLVCCELTVRAVLFDDGSDTEELVCFQDDDNQILRPRLHSPLEIKDIPQLFTSTYHEQIGNRRTHICFPGASVHSQDFEMILPSSFSALIIYDYNPHDYQTPRDDIILVNESAEHDQQLQGRSRRRLASPLGIKEFLYVRVSGKDESPTKSLGDLQHAVGTASNSARNDFRKQYHACSGGALTIEPAPDNAAKGISKGCRDLELSDKLKNEKTDAVEEAVHTALEDEVGNLNQFDLIMFCLPGGTKRNGNKNWFAYAYYNRFDSYFNDGSDACDSMSAHLHEIGHNFNVAHSKEGDDSYGDQTCLMGYSYYGVGPDMCFNGAKQYEFGWFADRVVELTSSDLPWRGFLGTFVDAGHEDDRMDAVIVKYGTHYMVYNRKRDHNNQVKEKANMVTVTQKVDGTRQTSNLKAGVAKNQNYKFNDDTTLTVCSLGTASGVVDTDYAFISITAKGDSVDCDVPSLLETTMEVPSQSPSAEPTSSPSNVPSPLPSITPSTMPSRNPSASPSTLPSLTPSLSPSAPPTPQGITRFGFLTELPSATPSVSPSTIPSNTPSFSPSNTPSFSPSDTPSLTPTIAPSSAPTLSPSEMPTETISSAPTEEIIKEEMTEEKEVEKIVEEDKKKEEKKKKKDKKDRVKKPKKKKDKKAK